MRFLPLALGAFSAALFGTQAIAGVTINVSSSAARNCYQSAEARARSQAAISQCSAALDSDLLNRDERVATLVNRGIVLMLADRAPEAIRDFDHALKLDSTEAEAYLNKGLTQYRIGNSADALALTSRALELRTKKPAVAYYVRALASEERGNVRGAYADLQRAAAIDPSWTEPATQLQRYRVTR